MSTFDCHLGELAQRRDDLVEPPASSTVTETLTSEVVTTSTDVRYRSNTSNTRRRNPCAISIRVDVMSTTVT